MERNGHKGTLFLSPSCGKTIREASYPLQVPLARLGSELHGIQDFNVSLLPSTGIATISAPTRVGRQCRDHQRHLDRVLEYASQRVLS